MVKRFYAMDKARGGPMGQRIGQKKCFFRNIRARSAWYYALIAILVSGCQTRAPGQHTNPQSPNAYIALHTVPGIPLANQQAMKGKIGLEYAQKRMQLEHIAHDLGPIGPTPDAP